MKFFSLIVLAVSLAVVLGEPELKPSGLKVENLSKPETCDKVTRHKLFYILFIKIKSIYNFMAIAKIAFIS